MLNAAGALFRSKDLLVPLALVTVAAKLLAWLAAAPIFGTLLTPSFPLRLLNLSFGISLSFLLEVALAVSYASFARCGQTPSSHGGPPFAQTCSMRTTCASRAASRASTSTSGLQRFIFSSGTESFAWWRSMPSRPILERRLLSADSSAIASQPSPRRSLHITNTPATSAAT